MFCSDLEQNILEDLRENLDLFVERIGEGEKSFENLNKFKETLLFKNYKDTGLTNVVEEELQF